MVSVRIALEGISFAQKPKVLKKKACGLSADHERDANGSDPNFQKNTEFMEVINAYLKPKCHPPDSDAVYRVLAVYPFNRHQLQQICAQFFGWPPEKTDEYILPKIAERDLRRYANLRCTSSNLGVDVSMDEMPVKCPISSIIKQRKLQGRDCFEVSWEEMHGLKASVVPADLVERACPERIMEFQERRAQGKKRNHCVSRPKKLGNVPSAEEIDLKLQRLLLDIENESESTRGASLSVRSKLEKTSALIHADLAIQELHLEDKLEKEADSVTILGCKSVAPSPRETEVVDLVSPLPMSASTSKRQVANVECIDLIELSESETEISPDHARKARDLRLFIANIKDD